LLCGPAHRLSIRYVGRENERFAAEALDFAPSAFKTFLPTGEESESPSAASEGANRRAADASRGACDYYPRSLSLKLFQRSSAS
jgi:hypothetical protein